MPEAVAVFAETGSVAEVRKVHEDVLRAYALDFARHAPANDAMKLTAVWDSVPGHLARENKKLVFSAIRKGARARDYEHAIQWLADAGLILKSYRVSAPRLPLSGYAEHRAFKVYMLDVGLLSTMSRVPEPILFEPSALFTEFKGALTENFVAQELAARHALPLYYWASEGRAEVDFVVPRDSSVYPLEVKAGASGRTKSLRVFGKKYTTPVLSRATLRNLSCDGGICNYPLYLVGRFPASFEAG
jgi:predicted AAA+ superfamily ATPase